MFFVMVLLSANVIAKNTITFLGIPVDGSKKEVTRKLQKKGFIYDNVDDVLYGEFNGREVCVQVQTVNNVVWRIVLFDVKDTDLISIRHTHDILYEQLLNNDKYTLVYANRIKKNATVPYEMEVNHERFDVLFLTSDKDQSGCLWYFIHRDKGRYRLVMFYENLINEPNGDYL